MKDETRFLKHIEKINDCWIWTATRSSKGLGLFFYKGKIKTAHRSAYRIFKGEIPDGMYVRQTCQNRLCVNPDHLETYQSSSTRFRAVLSPDEVRTIKDLLSLGVPQRTIAKSIGVSISTISHIATKRLWADVC